MSKKQDDYYFDNFMKCAEYSCKAAYLLKEILTEFQPEEISKKMEEIHEIERQADTQRHEITDKLAKAFITPIEREDIIALSHHIDDVTDKIEEVLILSLIHILIMYKAGSLLYFGTGNSILGKKTTERNQNSYGKNIMADI